MSHVPCGGLLGWHLPVLRCAVAMAQLPRKALQDISIACRSCCLSAALALHAGVTVRAWIYDRWPCCSTPGGLQVTRQQVQRLNSWAVCQLHLTICCLCLYLA
jgi:hypothetical protein